MELHQFVRRPTGKIGFHPVWKNHRVLLQFRSFISFDHPQLQQESDARGLAVLLNARSQLMPSLSVPVPLGLQQQQQLNAFNLQQHYNSLLMQSRTTAAGSQVSAQSTLDSLLRTNGIHSDSIR